MPLRSSRFSRFNSINSSLVATYPTKIPSPLMYQVLFIALCALTRRPLFFSSSSTPTMSEPFMDMQHSDNNVRLPMFTIDHPTLFATVRIINIAETGRRPTIHPLRFGMFAGQDNKISEEGARSANNRIFVRKIPSLPDSEPPRRRRRLPAPLAGTETSSAPMLCRIRDSYRSRPARGVH